MAALEKDEDGFYTPGALKSGKIRVIPNLIKYHTVPAAPAAASASQVPADTPSDEKKVADTG